MGMARDYFFFRREESTVWLRLYFGAFNVSEVVEYMLNQFWPISARLIKSRHSLPPITSLLFGYGDHMYLSNVSNIYSWDKLIIERVIDRDVYAFDMFNSIL
jgi:hypothetical protein